MIAFLRKMVLSLAAAAGIANLGVFVAFFIFEDPEVWTSNMFYYVIAALTLLGAQLWQTFSYSRARKKKVSVDDAIWYVGTVIVRFTLASVLLLYAYAKFLGLQFESQLADYDKTIGESTGLGLAWSFFGYSFVYASFIGASQMVCCVLLFFRRTVLLATIMLLPIMVNITIMDFTHHINAEDVAITLLFQTLVLLSPHLRRLLDFFWNHSAVPALALDAPIAIGGRQKGIIKVAVVLSCLVYPFLDNYMIKEKYTLRSPLRGAWTGLATARGGDILRDYYRIDTVRTKLFIEDGFYGTLVDDRGRGFYELNLLPDSSGFEMTFYNDSLQQRQVKGRYKLWSRDTLEITGRQGGDSIRWLFKRRHIRLSR